MTTRPTVTKMAGLWLAMGAAGLPFDVRANEKLSPNLALASYAGADAVRPAFPKEPQDRRGRRRSNLRGR
jgi:hypothetical protein